MKSRLLKQLRAEARRKYGVEEVFAGRSEYQYYTVERGYTTNFRTGVYDTFGEAKEACDCIRRQYILRKVSEKRAIAVY